MLDASVSQAGSARCSGADTDRVLAAVQVTSPAAAAQQVLCQVDGSGQRLPVLVTTDRPFCRIAFSQVLCQVTVQGKGYLHPDGRVATCRLRLDRLLEYVPKGPSERVVSVHYSSSDNHSSGALSARISEQLVGQVDSSRGVSRGGIREGQHSSSVAVPAMRLVEELQEAAWGVEN